MSKLVHSSSFRVHRVKSRTNAERITNNSSRGFTLIELLVAITIVAILSIIGIGIYNSTVKTAKDTKIKQDINTIANALEQHYNPIDSTYPADLEDDWFNSGSKPKTSEGTNYSVCQSAASRKSFNVCATLSNGEVYCKWSAYGDIPPQCIASTNPTPTPSGSGGGGGGGGGGGSSCTACGADVNRDGVVNSSDTILPACLGQSPTGNCVYYDTNLDNIVNQADSLCIQSKQSQTCAPKAFACEIFGDANRNGQLTYTDIKAIEDYINDPELYPLDADKQFIADVSDTDDATSVVNATDRNQLLSYLGGISSSVNACSNAKNPPCFNTNIVTQGGMGDVTNDGKVTILDAREVSRMVTSNPNSIYTNQAYTDDQRKRGDINYNGTLSITISDVTRIQWYLDGTYTSFSACSWNPWKYVFATSTTYTGNLMSHASALSPTNGLDAGDKLCKQVADASTITNVQGRTWKAWLSDQTGSPSTRFSQSTLPYKLTDGSNIASDWADLIDADNLLHAINRNESGQVLTSPFEAWTNTMSNGTIHSNFSANNITCSNWSGTPGNAPGTGLTASTTASWTWGATFQLCTSSYHLYCFEQ